MTQSKNGEISKRMFWPSILHHMFFVDDCEEVKVLRMRTPPPYISRPPPHLLSAGRYVVGGASQFSSHRNTQIQNVRRQLRPVRALQLRSGEARAFGAQRQAAHQERGQRPHEPPRPVGPFEEDRHEAGQHREQQKDRSQAEKLNGLRSVRFAPPHPRSARTTHYK